MESKQRVGIIFGGKSGEHEVSLLSAASVIRAMNRQKYELVYIGITREGVWKRYLAPVDSAEAEELAESVELIAAAIEEDRWEEAAEEFCFSQMKDLVDFALPIVHGPYCEDGKLQGLLEMLDIPYGGCGVLASAVAMDKILAKEIFRVHGLPICRHVTTTKEMAEKSAETVAAQVEEMIGFPCFVKPANMGSSVGISKAVDHRSFIDALHLAVQYDRRILIEEGLDCREVETAVLGNMRPSAAAVGEILSGSEFYDYEAKYTDGHSQLAIPAALSPEDYEKIRELAVAAYQAIDGEGYARVDFFIERGSGKIYINEINTIPGFTKYSMFPLLWREAGLEYDKLLERIIELGYERYYDKNNRDTSI
ncbi:MAG: D-alanine--D-alanine ligase [Firmicutes bacterium]|nr:D-alanine--D-alanine ligase [Bacillota bacterium]